MTPLLLLLAAPPSFATIDDLGPTTVVLRGDLSPKRARWAERKARQLYRDVNRRFIRPNKADDAEREPVDIYLFDSTAAYQKFVDEEFGPGDHSRLGFYVPARRIVVANLKLSVGNLRHEMAHALIGDDFVDIPSWLNEGIGSLYGNVKAVRKDRLDFTVNYRLRHLREARARGELPSLARLARSGRDEVYGPEAMTYYALSRYVLLYLDRRGSLASFYEEMRAAPRTPKKQLEVLRRFVDERTFLRWSARL